MVFSSYGVAQNRDGAKSETPGAEREKRASEARGLAPVRMFCRQERLHHDLVRLHADRNNGQQGIFRRLKFLLRLAFLNYGEVPGTGVGDQQIILILRKRQRVGMGSDWQIRYYLA